MPVATSPRTLSSNSAPSAPPAIWAAFVRQAAWKNWVLGLQLGVIGVLVLANLRLAQKEPDVVLVTGDGKSTYLSRSVAGESLTRFLSEQRHQPTDAGVVHFTREFLRLALAVNSSTIEEAWPAALAMMAPGLRERLEREAKAQRILETYRAAQVRTRLDIEDVVLLDHTESLFHVQARLSRTKSTLVDGKPEAADRLSTDLVLRVVPRTSARPDGLEILEWRVEPIAVEPRTPTPSASKQEKSDAN